MDIDITKLREDLGIIKLSEKRSEIVWRKNHKDFGRIAEMRKMRFLENKSLKEIGEIFGISRERVRQIIGNTGKKFRSDNYARQIEKIDSSKTTVRRVMEETGIGECLIRKVKKGERWKIEETGTPRSKAFGIEEFVSRKLIEYGIKNKLMPNSHKYDIETEGGISIEVKARFSRCLPPSAMAKSPGNSGFFHFKTSRERHADFLILVIAEGDMRECFVIPAKDIKADYIRLGWPMKKWNGYLKYHNGFSQIAP